MNLSPQECEHLMDFLSRVKWHANLNTLAYRCAIIRPEYQGSVLQKDSLIQPVFINTHGYISLNTDECCHTIRDWTINKSYEVLQDETLLFIRLDNDIISPTNNRYTYVGFYCRKVDCV